jgi:hypothetical protein
MLRAGTRRNRSAAAQPATPEQDTLVGERQCPGL